MCHYIKEIRHFVVLLFYFILTNAHVATHWLIFLPHAIVCAIKWSFYATCANLHHYVVLSMQCVGIHITCGLLVPRTHFGNILWAFGCHVSNSASLLV